MHIFFSLYVFICTNNINVVHNDQYFRNKGHPFATVHFILVNYWLTGLTLSPPSTTVVPYSNSLDLDETSSNSTSHPDPSCLTLGKHFHKLQVKLQHFEKMKHTRNLADDNLFGGQRVKRLYAMLQTLYSIQVFIFKLFFFSSP